MCLPRGTDCFFKYNSDYSLFGRGMAKTVVASLSSWRPGFYLRSAHVRFVVDREVMGQVFQRVH